MREEFRLAAFADEADPGLDGQIRALSENSIPLVELRGINGKNISSYTPSEAEKVASCFARAGIGVWSIGSPIGKVPLDADFEEHLNNFRNILKIAEATGAECVRLFSFYNNGRTGDDVRKEVTERLKRFAEAAEKSGIVLCHENEKGIYGDSDVRCAGILGDVPALRAVFDPANFVQCGVDTLKAWELLKDKTCYLHIKDADNKGRVVPPGCGDGNLTHIIKEFLSLDGASGVMTVEPHLHAFVGLSELSESDAGKAVGALRFACARDAFDYAVSSLRKLIEDIHKGGQQEESS